MPVQFPFGHGESYTTFAYSLPEVSAFTFKDEDGLTVSVSVTNTGTVAGKEVVQVYVHDHKSALVRPAKELKGFAKVELQPGETRTVTIPLDFRAFAYYHPGYRQWVTEDGEFDILIGASSADIRCTETVTLQSSLKLPSLLNNLSTIRDWLEDPKGKVIAEPLIGEIMAKMMKLFGAGENAAPASGMEDMVLDMPLLALLEFQENDLPIPPGKIVDRLLEQLRGVNE